MIIVGTREQKVRAGLRDIGGHNDGPRALHRLQLAIGQTHLLCHIKIYELYLILSLNSEIRIKLAFSDKNIWTVYMDD